MDPAGSSRGLAGFSALNRDPLCQGTADYGSAPGAPRPQRDGRRAGPAPGPRGGTGEFQGVPVGSDGQCPVPGCPCGFGETEPGRSRRPRPPRTVTVTATLTAAPPPRLRTEPARGSGPARSPPGARLSLAPSPPQPRPEPARSPPQPRPEPARSPPQPRPEPASASPRARPEPASASPRARPEPASASPRARPEPARSPPQPRPEPAPSPPQPRLSPASTPLQPRPGSRFAPFLVPLHPRAPSPPYGPGPAGSGSLGRPALAEMRTRFPGPAVRDTGRPRLPAPSEGCSRQGMRSRQGRTGNALPAPLRCCPRRGRGDVPPGTNHPALAALA
ncbi:keratinocyte proline-rich protein-like [Aphelocoma coerulescens]|uniref:keratinocyte proline-rich protein-like n=1 Tax=Aphelocoma coerulescens TaxID=39617 RepID=UPI003604D6B5